MSTNSSDSFHNQLAAVIEVLANSAVAEICKLVDDGYAVLRLEITQNQREIDGLRRKLLVAKFQTSRRNHHQRSSSTVHVTRGTSAPSRARCNPATKSSTQGTGGEEEGGGAGFPVILKVEGDDNTLKDIQPPVKHGSETNTTPRTLAVERENHLHCDDQRFNTHHHSNGNVNLFTSASEWAEAGAGIEVWNNDGSLTTGNCSIDPPHTSGPHQEGRTRSNREGSPGASEDQGGDISGDPSNVAPFLAGNLDWEPDMVVVDSVPIKVDENMSSEWSIIDRHGITRSAKQRLQKHGREEELETARARAKVTRGTSAPSRARCNPATKSSTQGTGGEEEGGGAGFPVILKVEGDDNTLKDIQPPVKHGSEICASEWAEAGAGIEVWNNDGSLTTGNCSIDPPHTSGPHQEGRTRSNREGSPGASEDQGGDIPGDPSNVAPFLAGNLDGNLDWEPDMVVAFDAGGQPHHCELCGRSFRKLQNLRQHQRMHTGEKPYGCRHCSKRFSRQHRLKTHERVHTGEKPFRCPTCGRCFVESSNMKRHLRIHT